MKLIDAEGLKQDLKLLYTIRIYSPTYYDVLDVIDQQPAVEIPMKETKRGKHEKAGSERV